MNGSFAIAARRPTRWDLLQLAVFAAVLLQVWRVQDLVHVLDYPGVPIAVGLVPLALYGLNRDPRRSLRLFRHPLVRVACGLLLLVILSIPGSLYPLLSVDFLLKDFVRSIILMIVVAASIRDTADVERYAWLQLAGATLICALVLSRYTMENNGRLEVKTYYYDVNDLSLLFVCTLPLAVYLLRPRRALLGRLLALVAVAWLVLGLVKMGSRGGFLGLLAGGAYMLVKLRAVPLRKRLGALGLMAALLVGLSTGRYWQMMESILHPSSDYNWSGRDEAGRMEVWKRGLGYMAAHPFFGVGAEAFPVAEGTLAPEAERQQEGMGSGFKWSGAHNSYVQIGAELGVLGLVLFVALLASGFRTLARIERGPPGDAAFLAQLLSASLVAYAVAGFFLSAAYWAYLYMLLGMALGLARVTSRTGSPIAAVNRPQGHRIERPSVRYRPVGPSAP